MPTWLSDLVGPRLLEIVTGSADETQDREPACERCGRTDEDEAWRACHRVCGSCGYHRPMPVMERLNLLLAVESGHVVELRAPEADPLKFRDTRRYVDRLREAEEQTGVAEAITVAHGRIDEELAVIAAVDPAFLDGTIGTAVGQGVLTAARLAVVQEASLILVWATGGLRMQEGLLAAAQIHRIAVAIEDVRQVGLPCLALVPNGATGSVTATLAALADFVIAEPGPDQAAVHADLIVERAQQPQIIAQLLRLIRRPRPSADVVALIQPEATVMGLDFLSARDGRTPSPE